MKITEYRAYEILCWLDDQAGDHTNMFEQMTLFRDAAALIRQLRDDEQSAWHAGLDAGREQGRGKDHATQPPSAPVGADGLPPPFGYIEPRQDLSGYEVFDAPGPRRAAIWNLHGMQQALAQHPEAVEAKDAEIETLKADVAAQRTRADAMAGEAIKHEARAERLAEAVKAKLHDWYARDRLDESDAQWMREKTYEQCADELTALLRGQEEGT